jgi:LPXTG-motif cell wall-anchored protein
MTFHSPIRLRTALAIVCGIGIAAGVAISPAQASMWDKKTVLTVNETVQIRDTVLEPGQYVLKLYDSQSDRHTVQIFNRDETHIINTVLAIPTERLRAAGHTEFTFWETPPGTNRALRTWFYPGDTIGQEFPYPKHLQQVTMLTSSATEMAMAAPAPEPVMAEPQPQPPAQSDVAEQPAQPESETVTPEATPEPAPEQQPAEVAQNTAPPPAETPAQSTPNQPAQLPTTGSPYPAIGLAGGLLLGLAGLLRLKRLA